MQNIISSSEPVAAPPALGDDRLPQRFWAKVRIAASGCWEWTAQTGHHGYARYTVDGRSQAAHRVAYSTLVGSIPGGLVIDHLCRVRHCVNPAHLEPVTNEENLRRGVSSVSRLGVQTGMAVINGAKTHCPKGHPYDGANLGVNRRGDRYCRECKNAQSRACHARNRAAAKAGA